MDNLVQPTTTNDPVKARPFPSRIQHIAHCTMVKFQIVVLGNQDPTYYHKHEKYGPVLTQNQMRKLVALDNAVQGDVKKAFCNGELPPNKTDICIPLKGCLHSQPGTIWKLKMTLYGCQIPSIMISHHGKSHPFY